jgi:nitrile hydratase accessory protein
MTSGPLPGQPFADDEPVFREPWEARVFALAVSLNQMGLITWTEWAAALGAQIEKAQGSGDDDLGDTYYCHWTEALETLVAERGLSSEPELAKYRGAWKSAAERTPHGQPIEVRADDCPR